VRYVDAPVVRFHDGNTDGDLDGGSEEGDNTLYYTTDANWNVTALVDAETGGVVERYMYDPYGKATVLNGESGYDADGQVTEWSVDTGGSDWANDVLYCGYRWDFETGLYQVRRRYYHPTIGRWVTSDPIGYEAGVNLHEYVKGRPITLTDPSGQVVHVVVVAAAVAAAGACMYPHFTAGMAKYPHNEEMRHCWTSCVAARTCGTVISAVFSLGFEVVTEGIRAFYGDSDFTDSVYDLMHNAIGLYCAGFESSIAGLGNITRWFRESCDCCCKRETKP